MLKKAQFYIRRIRHPSKAKPERAAQRATMLIDLLYDIIKVPKRLFQMAIMPIFGVPPALQHWRVLVARSFPTATQTCHALPQQPLPLVTSVFKDFTRNLTLLNNTGARCAARPGLALLGFLMRRI